MFLLSYCALYSLKLGFKLLYTILFIGLAIYPKVKKSKKTFFYEQEIL